MNTQQDRWLHSIFDFVLLAIDRWAVLLLTTLAIILILPGLGLGSLRDWDEAIYAQVSKEMILSGDWINLHHGYEPYFEKPPFLMWTIAISYKLFGINEFSARLPSAVSGLMLVFVTYRVGKELYDKRAGLLAGLILLSSRGFIFNARNGTTNMMLTLFIFIGIYGYIKLRRGDPRWWYLVLGSYGFAFMVKLWAANVLPLIIIFTLLLENKLWETLSNKHFWGGILLAALIILPWHTTAYLSNPEPFFHAYISRNLVQRTLTEMEGHRGTSFYYVNFLLSNFSPWFFLIPFMFALSFNEILNQEKRSNILVVTVLLVFGLFTFLVRTKINNYILPIYPALALLTAHLFRRAFFTGKSDHILWVLTGTLIALPVFQNMLLLMSIFIVLLFAVLWKIKFLDAVYMYPLATALILGGFFISGVLNTLRDNNRINIVSAYRLPDTPVAHLATRAGQVNPSKSDPIIGFAVSDPDGSSRSMVEGPTAVFYSNRPVHVALTWEQLEQDMSDHRSGEIIIAAFHVERLSENFDLSVIETAGPLVYATFSQE